MDNTEILRGLADNGLLFEAVKKAVLAEFADTRDDDSQFSDERLGQMYRAIITGRSRVETAFKNIEKCRTTEERPGRINRGR